MSKKYAFLLMGKDFNPQRDHACFSAGGVDSYIITVRSPEEAVKKARELADEGFGALEVCGAFGENLAREMYQAADRRLTVSYVVCPKDQEESMKKAALPAKDKTHFLKRTPEAHAAGALFYRRKC